MQERIEQIKAKVAECVAAAEQRFGITMPSIAIRFDLRGRAAGQAGKRYGQHYLRFNREHIALGGQTWDHLLNDTVPHEVAHVVCYAFPQYGRAHDSGWKRVCLALGGNGKRCYSAEDAPEAAAAARPYIYITTLGHEVRVTKVVHSKIQRGATYTAKGKGQLTAQCQYNYMAAPVADKPLVLSNKKVEVPIAKPKTAYVERPANNGSNKATAIRLRIALAKARGEMKHDVVLYGVQALGMTKALASAYVKNNWDKV